MTKCFVCECELKESPTYKWYMDLSWDKQICYDCIIKLAKSVLFAMEKEARRKIKAGEKFK